MVADDLAAHDAVEVTLQVRKLTRQVFELVIGDHADMGIFQRHRVAGVAVGADAVQAEQFASHLKPRDLIPAVL